MWAQCPTGNLVHHLDPEAFQRHDFPRMVGQQPDRVQPQVREYLGADPVLVLQLPLARFALVMHEIAPVAQHARRSRALAIDPETGTRLVQVHQDALSGIGNGVQRVPNQPRAIAIGGTEHIAEDAPRVHTHQHVLLAGHLAADQRQMVLGVQIAAVGDGAELAEFGRNGAFGHAVDEFFVFQPVADQVGHREHFQVVALAEFHQLRHPCHGAVVIHDLANNGRRIESGQTRNIHVPPRYGPCAPARRRHGPQRKHVAGRDDVGCPASRGRPT